MLLQVGFSVKTIPAGASFPHTEEQARFFICPRQSSFLGGYGGTSFSMVCFRIFGNKRLWERLWAMLSVGAR
jgi:hypothetical protein